MLQVRRPAFFVDNAFAKEAESGLDIYSWDFIPLNYCVNTFSPEILLLLFHFFAFA